MVFAHFARATETCSDIKTYERSPHPRTPVAPQIKKSPLAQRRGVETGPPGRFQRRGAARVAIFWKIYPFFDFCFAKNWKNSKGAPKKRANRYLKVIQEAVNQANEHKGKGIVRAAKPSFCYPMLLQSSCVERGLGSK